MIPQYLIDKAVWAAHKHLSELDDDRIAGVSVTWGDNPPDVIADGAIRVSPLIEAALKTIAADIWDDGFEAGEGHGYAIGRDLGIDASTPNPYRASETA